MRGSFETPRKMTESGVFMDKKKPSKDERGNVRYLWVLVGAYLLYLAWQQLQLLLRGEAVNTGDMILGVVSGAVFAAVGAWVIYREWRAWQYAQAHKDDPETWGDASEAYPDAPELKEDENAEEAADGVEKPESEVAETDGAEPESEENDGEEENAKE